MAQAPAFDPSKPFETVAPPFDPSKPFETVNQPAGDTFADRFAGERPRPPVQMLEHGISTTPLPQPVLDRIERGMKEGWGDAPIGADEARIQQGRDLGWFNDPLSDKPMSITKNIGEAAFRGTADAFDILTRAMSAGFHGAAEAVAGKATEIGGEKIGREAQAMFEWYLNRGDINLARPHLGPDGVIRNQVIGTLPKDADFATGAAVLSGEAAAQAAYSRMATQHGVFVDLATQPVSDPALIEKNLRTLWEERGIHPAEAVHDAQGDAFLKQELAPPSFVAFHASPHDFDAFKPASEIAGTGQGAATFGHGIYVSESLGVHKAYLQEFNLANKGLLDTTGARDLAKFFFDKWKGEVTDPSSARELALTEINREIKPYIDQGEALEEHLDMPKPLRQLVRAKAVLESADPLSDYAVSYQVRIHADQEHFLDWDKPLSEQSEFVKDALSNHPDPIIAGTFAKHGDVPGTTAYNRIAQRLGGERELGPEGMKYPVQYSDEAKASAALAKAGIPGIKYLDQGSRAAGEGSRNFVVFDHNAIEITHKNGVALEPTKVPPVVGSPMPEGTPRTELARTGDPLIDRILQHPTMQRVINNPVVDDTHEIPNSWGGSVPQEDPTLFISKQFPKLLTVDGVTFSPVEGAAPHENIEQFVSTVLVKAGWSPAKALKVAFWEFGEKVEDAVYHALGIDPKRAEATIAPYVDQIAARKEAPIAQFRRDFAAINRAIPPAEPGYTRLWRGNRPGEIGKSTTFTNDAPGIALPFRKAYGGDLSYVDVPTADLAKYEQSGAVAPGSEFNLPTEIAATARIAPNITEGGIPSNLFRDTYPGSDPRKAAPGPIDKPTAAEIAEAREIIAKHLDDEAGLSPAGADVTRPENLPTLAEQPPLPRGLIVAEARQAIDKAFGLVDNVKLLLNPMVTGSMRAIVIAKNAISAVRRIHYEHFQQDAEIMRRWPDPEDRKLMWEAGDEESVLRQEGMQESGAAEHMGWNRLPDDMRRFVEWLDGEGQAAWMHAIDAGLVEGEGLPAYMTRMLLNMAMVGPESPRALNELGRNVFTRTAQMLHRGNLMAEETEAAAKELVRTRMEKAGATPEAIEEAVGKVQIARDIRALPLAIRRMKEAAIWKNMIDHIDQLGKATGQELVFDSPGPGRFTIEGNPAFTKWGPDYALNPVTGRMEARVDDAGKVIFKTSPIYMDNEFKGPMLSILDEGTSKSVLVQGTQSTYGALMSLKGKAMTAILNSPLIHNEVVWGKVVEAAGGREWLGFGLYSRGYRMQVANPGRAEELVERGLFPMGHLGPIQDINAIMAEPTLTPGRSITAKVFGAVPGLFDAGAELTVRRKIDQLGDFWHNTLLWDRVRDVQFGLADHLSDRFVAKGLDRYTADVVAAHMANMVVGSIPKEAMSGFARATANMALFSRSFTLGNWAMIKQAIVGLPKPIVALIEDHAAQAMELRRNVDGSFGPDSMPAEEMLQIATKTAKSMGKWKAISMLGFSIVLMEGVNAAFQHAFNIMSRDSTVDDELQGYARRYAEMMKEGPQLWPPVTGILSQLSPTHDNEPGHQDRAHLGFDKDGRAQYWRSPVGKYGEEIQGMLTMPMTILKRKLNPVGPRPFLEWMMNDKSLGDWEKPDRIYDPHETGAWADIKAAYAVAENFLTSAMPKQQINAATDLLRGEGDDTTNKFRLFGPAAGFTVSVGAPGGMAKGELYASKNRQETQFDLAWPDIRRQIQRGDEQGARQVMDALHLTPREQNFRINIAKRPGDIGSRALRNFYQHATPTEMERFLNAPRAP